MYVTVTACSARKASSKLKSEQKGNEKLKMILKMEATLYVKGS